MPMGYAQLISRNGTSEPTTVPLGLFSLVANLSYVDRYLKKAGLDEMRPFFESDDETWLRLADVVKVFESARTFLTNASEGDGHLWEAVAEQLDDASDILRALPKGSVIRLEIITPKLRKPAKPKPAPAAASNPLSMKLPKQSASAVVEAMSREETKLSFEGFVAHWLQYDARQGIANWRERHPTWPEKWLERRYRFLLICDPLNGWYLRGIARRAATGDLDEFGLFIQMQVRQAVMLQPAADNSATDVNELLLPALAIGDQPAIERHLAKATFPKPGAHMVVYNGVQALLRDDPAEIDRLRKAKVPKSTSARTKGLVHCLQGIAAGDASRVAAGIEEHLNGFYKAFCIDPIEKILSLDAHAMFRLAERIDPKLTLEFNTDRDVPWDREFHAWSTDWLPTLAVDHFGDCPEDLCAPFVTLEIPPWLDDKG
ncbi:MAG TPA: hypothetical protein VG826_02940 [Pirellulales bacterium]|nr:hypothetical protein [Pirellulales bacterium]